MNLAGKDSVLLAQTPLGSAPRTTITSRRKKSVNDGQGSEQASFSFRSKEPQSTKSGQEKSHFGSVTPFNARGSKGTSRTISRAGPNPQRNIQGVIERRSIEKQDENQAHLQQRFQGGKGAAFLNKMML